MPARITAAVSGSTGIADHAWTAVPVDPDTAVVMRAGMRILHDPEDRLQRALDDASRTCPEQPG